MNNETIDGVYPSFPKYLIAEYHEQKNNCPEAITGVEFDNALYFFGVQAELVSELHNHPLDKFGKLRWCIIPKDEHNNLAITLSNNGLLMAVVKDV